MNNKPLAIIILTIILVHASAQHWQFQHNIQEPAEEQQEFNSRFLYASSTLSADEWKISEREIIRLAPTEFMALPQSIVDELKVQGCTIPQTYGDKEPHNVIRGSFAAQGQMDWAVLCSRKGESMIYVFWGGPARCPSPIAPGKDAHWLQTTGDGEIGYSRLITTLDKQTIVEYQAGFGAPEAPVMPEITHQGIDDYFMGKASIVHYCSHGQWLALSGAD